MTRKEAEEKLAAFGKQVVWFRSPFAATALAPTVLLAIGVSPTLQQRRRIEIPAPLNEREAGTQAVAGALRAALERQLTSWPRPAVEVPDSVVDDLRAFGMTRVGDAMSRLAEIRHQLNSHVDSSIGCRNTLFTVPATMLFDGTLAYLFSGAVVAIDEPDFFRFDNEGRVHGETGPALRWRDGWSVYAWHGTVVPEAWIREKDKIDVETALTWPNLEERRAAAEIMGWKKVLVRLNAKEVDRHPDPTIGTLWHAELPLPAPPPNRWMEEVRPEDAPRFRAPPRTEPCRFIEVKCGTGRTFVIPVPPTIQTAMAAQEWMWGLGPGEYQPEART